MGGMKEDSNAVIEMYSSILKEIPIAEFAPNQVLDFAFLDGANLAWGWPEAIGFRIVTDDKGHPAPAGFIWDPSYVNGFVKAAKDGAIAGAADAAANLATGGASTVFRFVVRGVRGSVSMTRAAVVPKGYWRIPPITSVVARPWQSVVVNISRRQYPGAARHIEDAIRKGHPRVLTIDRSGAARRRGAATSGTPTKAGYDRDEYPPALFKEGGAGASVRHVKIFDNRGSGSSFRWQLDGVPDGAKVFINIVD
jgi:hypothetical protein